MKPMYFDDALPAFANLVKQQWGETALQENLFLRDASGRLTFIVLSSNSATDARIVLASLAQQTLGRYVDGDGFAVATPEELFDERLRERHQARLITLASPLYSGEITLIDRRLVGADWLRDPAPPASAPPRCVFASIKGGVGRSTALCVIAAHFASRGKRILTIDMDLEAPGLGNMLLPDGTLPEFGLLDYLVESSLGELDDAFLPDMIGPSWLGGGMGRVDVIPAIGRRSMQSPANVLAKIARAYLGGNRPNALGETSSFADQMSELLAKLADPLRYDLILLDARAGLHETTAAAMVGLGAEVFLFGIDQPQTLAGYELLFAHLATLPCQPNSDDWRQRLHLVQAKAPTLPAKRLRFAQEMETMMRQMLWPAPMQPVPDLAELKDSFEVEWSEQHAAADAVLLEEDTGPAPPLAILQDERFATFNPLADQDILLEQAYGITFKHLLDAVRDIVDTYNKDISDEH